MFQSMNLATTGCILLVENDRKMIGTFDTLLRAAGYDTICVTDPQSVIQTAGTHSPDLVLLDVMHCGGDGMDLCRRLRADRRCSRLPLILWSESNNEADRVLGLELGADDFVSMPFGNRELLARIKSLLRRSKLPQSEIVKHGDLLIDVACCQVKFREAPVALTATEFRILHFLAQSPQRVHSREKIMEAVHFDALDVTERSVDPHVNTIRRKLGEGGKHIETVRGFGYRLN